MVIEPVRQTRRSSAAASRSMLIAILASALLGACATPTVAPRPAIDLPASWSQAPAGASIAERWWTLFGDPALERLVDEALAHNLDLEIAATRIVQARAAAGLAEADRYPSISARASSVRSKSTLEGSFPRPAGVPRIQTTSGIGLDASYELDLWGRYAQASAAARADLLASEWAREALRLSLVAEVIKGYHGVRAATLSEANLERTLAARNETLAMLGQRVAAGSASEFDLNQTRAEIAGLQAQIAQAAQLREERETQLGILLGRSPRALFEDPLPQGDAARDLAPQVPVGLPSELLLRRPDLRQAEAALAAADARVDEARALLFPSISLTASLGQESVSLSRLFNGSASIFNLGLGLTQPIWNAGRLQSNLAATRAAREQEVARYRQAIANAFADVRRALAAQRAAIASLDAETQRATALRATVDQARVRFDAGLGSGLEVLDAERNLLQAELALIDARAALQGAITDLIRALGGGWRPGAEAPAAS